jgi:HSP20 family molecular chaperone IbpA
MANENLTTKPATEPDLTAERTRCGSCYRPDCDIIEKPDELLVVADVPGANADAIDVKFEDGALTINVAVEPRQPEDTSYVHREYGVGDYYRTFQVSEAIDVAKITADFADGVLTLHLPKAEALKPRKIKVN